MEWQVSASTHGQQDGRKPSRAATDAAGLPQEGRSESTIAREEGTVLPAADSTTESPTSSDRLMESICDQENLDTAMAKVIANGAARC